jgi:hypothetical protein
MSYDLRVWGRKVADLGSILAASRGWTEHDGLRRLESDRDRSPLARRSPLNRRTSPTAPQSSSPRIASLVERSL